MTDEPMFMSREQAARKAGVSLDTLRRALNRGDLKAKRTSRDKNGEPAGRYLISEDALREWFDSLPDAS